MEGKDFMKNIKSFGVVSDGNMKRIAITYDELNEEGKVINSNVRLNRLITNADVLTAVAQIEVFAQTVVDAQ